MLHLPRESRRLSRARIGGALAALAVLLTLSPPPASAQEQAKPDREDTRVLPGRIFVVCNSRSSLQNPLAGLIAVDPNTGAWSRLTERFDPYSRASFDGKFAVLWSPEVTGSLSIHDVLGQKEPLAIFRSTAVAFGCWYPDNEHILVCSQLPPNPSTRFEKWRVSADGSKREKLPIPETEFVQEISRDGQWFVTFSSRAAPDALGSRTIDRRALYLMHPDGTGDRILRPAVAPQVDGETTIYEHVYCPRFSPDSRKVLWTEDAIGRGARPVDIGRIVVADIDGTHRRVVLEGKVEGRLPFGACWSPDGKAIAVTTHEGQETPRQQISRLEILDEGGKPIRTIPLPEVPGAPRTVIDWR